MSVFRSASLMLSTAFNTVTGTLNTVEKGLDIANHYVAENHKRITKTTTTAAQLSVARFNADVAIELDSSAELQAQYDKVVADW